MLLLLMSTAPLLWLVLDLLIKRNNIVSLPLLRPRRQHGLLLRKRLLLLMLLPSSLTLLLLALLLMLLLRLLLLELLGLSCWGSRL